MIPNGNENAYSLQFGDVFSFVFGVYLQEKAICFQGYWVIFMGYHKSVAAHEFMCIIENETKKLNDPDNSNCTESWFNGLTTLTILKIYWPLLGVLLAIKTHEYNISASVWGITSY